MAQSPDRNSRRWRKIWNWFRPIRESYSEVLAGKPTEPASEEFPRDVAAAFALLKFLIKEGGPEPIRDQIIDDIEAAREVVKDSAPPKKEDRVKLLKAYRDLVTVPRISVASARIPPVTFWSVDSQWPRLLIWTSIVPSIAALSILLIVDHEEWYWALAYLILSSFAVSGLYVFTGLVTTNKLNQIIRFCYIFTGFALVGSLLPFTLPDLFAERASLKTSSEAPLGILLGCAEAPQGQLDWHPREVLCERGSQWVLRIGGTTTQSNEKPAPSGAVSVTVTPPSATVKPGKTVQFNASVSGSPNSQVTWLIDPPDAGTISQGGSYVAPDSATAKPVTIKAQSVADPTKSASASVKVEPAGEKPAPTSAPEASSATAQSGQTPAPPSAPGGSAAPPQSGEKPAAPPATGTGATIPKAGERPAALLTMRRQITGGLVVPLYVIVLALVGGAISMTRRVPEYQRRALDVRDPLTNAEAREYLVFQIMQVFTAPLIAVTAYYIYRPATPVESVVLGFASGFASEPILVMIRALVDKLRPAIQAPQPNPISVAVTPSSATVQPKGTTQFSAKVSGSPNSEVTWLIDPPDSAGTISQSGYYTAPEPPPTKAVTITARSVADPTKSASASVKFEPAGQKPAPSGAISVTVTPPSATVKPGKTVQFNASVSGPSNSQVTWLIDPPDAGTISQSGSYVAPDSATAKPITIKAQSVADPTKSASASVKVEQ